jgi:hypothetical protein
VLITEPIENLDIKGTFHLDRAIIILEILETEYYGGRNLDFDVENTTEFAQTEIVQNKLEELLKEVILPNQNLKLPIVGVESWASVIRTLSFPNCLKMSIVALGGMGNRKFNRNRISTV